MRRLSLPEYASRIFPVLPPASASALAGTGAVRAAATLDGGGTMLTASSTVGVVSTPGVELRVHPKVAISRLLWLLGFATDPAGWRDEDVGLAVHDDLVAAMAVTFLRAARQALAPGVLQGYRLTEEALPVLRGRLREADQLRVRLGRPLPLEVRYDDYTTDIPENQLLLAATVRLLHLPGLPPNARRELHRLLVELDDVRLLAPGEQPPAITPTRLNARYTSALRLARLVLASRSLEQPAGDATANAFLFDLNVVFESWLTAALRSELEERGGRVDDGRVVYLDLARRLAMQPDITWWDGPRCLAVVDAKYKALHPGSFPHADVYQMFAYCTALGLPVGHLVYAAGNEDPAIHAVVRAGVRIIVHSLPLALPVPALLAHVAGLARRLGTRAMRPPQGPKGRLTEHP